MSEDFISVIVFFAIVAFFFLIFRIKKVPSKTVYIIDRNTHYHKTVKHGFFFFNPTTDKITTEISLSPKTKRYFDFYETEDGRVCSIGFNITYCAQDVDDVLYNLSSTRRSIDDVIQGSMYHAVLSLKLLQITPDSLTREFERNISSQVLGLCIQIINFKLISLDKVNYSKHSVKVFTPHISRSLGADSGPFKYND